MQGKWVVRDPVVEEARAHWEHFGGDPAEFREP